MPFKDECGVFGIYNHPDAAKVTYLGLYALQHRGQESAGIVSYDGTNIYVVKDMGLVSEVFNPENLSYLQGQFAIGHVRYSTTGSSSIANIQPLYSQTSKGRVAIAHNGNITNAFSVYHSLSKEGALFQSTVDSEVLLHLFSKSKNENPSQIMEEILQKIEGAYSLVILGENFLVGARDPYGFRPLVLGQLGDATILCSESCALDLIGASYIREVKPGEIILVTEESVHSHHLPLSVQPAFCIFEQVYFARPDSIVFGETVHEIRKKMGHVLAREHPVDADLVMAIPDSGNSAALGFSEESRIPFEFGMTRNHYVGRTFIQPEQKIRDFGVKVKLNPIKSVLKDKRVVVVDDSLVRGTTSRQRVATIREAGAKEVHLRICSPPIRFPCHYGIDTPDQSKLIAANKTVSEIMRYMGADSLGYLSQEGMLSVVQAYPPSHYCTACFDGNYPLEVKDKGKYVIETKKIKLYAEKRKHIAE